MNHTATIAAIATPPGRGGIGVIRISGALVREVAQKILGQIPTPRYALYTPFLAEDQSIIDQGLALYFPAPHSFTGEDVLELQAHGGQIILDLLLQRILKLGVDLARPGEFSERAFLNGKLDLIQSEAIADLIDADSVQTAQAAQRSLQGEFSRAIQRLVKAITELRVYIEAAIDFSTEDLHFLENPQINTAMESILNECLNVQQNASQGTRLRDGMKVVIAGKPNAGKSSLLNQLSQQETAIVTDIPGTTRDILRVHIQMDGLPLHIIDTAGLRDSEDPIEQEGIRRARQEIADADHIILVIDARQENLTQNFSDLLSVLCRQPIPPSQKMTLVINKIDLLSADQLASMPSVLGENLYGKILLSAKLGTGLVELRQHLKLCLGFTATPESLFMARRRHLEAIHRACQHLLEAQQHLKIGQASELLAEELRLAQNALGEITGTFLPDDLLGKIFSSFCIGK